jgi:phage-related protein
MQPFTKQQLATEEDYKYRGYIPVDHTIFNQENTFSGTVNVTEEVKDLNNVPRNYIDEVDDPEWNA